MRTIHIRSEEETAAFGRRLAEELGPGSLVALIGDLGAGKTTLSKYIAEGLGVTEVVTSPTFTIVHEYHTGRVPLYHFDVYRLSDPAEMEELGYEEYFFGEGVCLVEWADRIRELLPADARMIRINTGATPEERVYHCNF